MLTFFSISESPLEINVPTSQNILMCYFLTFCCWYCSLLLLYLALYSSNSLQLPKVFFLMDLLVVFEGQYLCASTRFIQGITASWRLCESHKGVRISVWVYAKLGGCRWLYRCSVGLMEERGPRSFLCGAPVWSAFRCQCHSPDERVQMQCHLFYERELSLWRGRS